MHTTTTSLPVPLRQDASIIATVGLAHGASHFGHLLLAPLIAFFMHDFGLGFAQVGVLGTVFFVISGLGQFASGFLVDRFGARPMLFAAIVLLALASVAAGLAQSYTGLLFAAVLAGLGNAPFHPIDFTILNQKVSHPRLGHAFSVHGFSGSLGWALAPVVLVGLAQANIMGWGWRGAYLGAFVLYAAVLLILWLQRDALLTLHGQRTAPQTSNTPHTTTAPPTVSFLLLPVVWWCFAFFFFSTITLAVVQYYAGAIFQNWYNISVKDAANMVSLYMLLSACGGLAGGFIVAKYGDASEKVVATCMSCGAALLLWVASGSLPASAALAILVATGFTLGLAGPSRDMTIKRATPKNATGRVYGTVYSGLDAGLALSPLLFGLLMDHKNYHATIAGAALSLLLGVAAALQVGKMGKK